MKIIGEDNIMLDYLDIMLDYLGEISRRVQLNSSSTKSFQSRERCR